jgi:hypothetical protein
MIQQCPAPYAALVFRLTLGSLFVAHLLEIRDPARRGREVLVRFCNQRLPLAGAVVRSGFAWRPPQSLSRARGPVPHHESAASGEP